MENVFKQNSVKVVALAILIIAGVSIYFYSSKDSPVAKGPQALAIESKGLAEFNAENNTINTVSPQDKKLAEEMMPVFKLMGDGKDIEKNKKAVTALSKVIEKYPEYSDAHFLQAFISILAGDKDYQKILSYIDGAIKFHSSDKYKSAYDSTAGMYSLRAKVDMLAGNYQQAMNDLEKAVSAELEYFQKTDAFGTGGTKPGDSSSPTALNQKDFDILVVKYPVDYRPYLFRAAFYNSFSIFDPKYYALAIQDYEKAISLNPQSAMVQYFLGKVYTRKAFHVYSVKLDSQTAYNAARDNANEKALQYFNETTKLDPKFTEAYVQIAEALYNLKRDSDAVPYYDKAIELDPNNFGAYNDRALAKTNIGDYYGAINDFSQAIDLKKSKSGSWLDSTYENRAVAYVKAGNYDRAIEDYSKAIGLKFAQQIILMSIPQIRTIYPELSDISDQNLIEGLRQKYYPNISSAEFSDGYQKKTEPFEDFVLADLYGSRGDTYLTAGNFKKATIEYARALHDWSKYIFDRWKVVSKTPDTEYSLDAQTLDFSQGNVVSLWVKSLNINTQSYFQSNFQINCSERKIKSVSATNYNSVGNVVGTIPAQDWQSIVPETIGEVLYSGMCRQ